VTNFARILSSDPCSASNQAAIENITDYLSLHDTSLLDDIAQPIEDLKSSRFEKGFEIEEYSESITKALYETFYSSAYLPCTCLERRGVLCLSNQFVSALRLDGHRYMHGNDDHYFFDSVIANARDETFEWTPVQFHLPR
jgi:hypothetical protein